MTERQIAAGIIAALLVFLVLVLVYCAWTVVAAWFVALFYRGRHQTPEPEPEPALEPLPPERTWAELTSRPLTVRWQDERGLQTMALPRGESQDAQLATMPVGPLRVEPTPREWRVGRSPSPFVINPPEPITSMAFRLYLPVLVPESGEPEHDPVTVAARVRQYYEDADWPLSEYLYHHAWFDEEGLAA